MIKRDNSDTMKNKKYTCEALLLDQSQFENHFKRHTESADEKWGMTSYIHSLAGLNSRIHEQSLRNSLQYKYFDAVKTSLEQSEHKL